MASVRKRAAKDRPAERSTSVVPKDRLPRSSESALSKDRLIDASNPISSKQVIPNPESALSNNEARVGRFFLATFVTLLIFFLGTGLGNRANESIVDSAIDQILSNAPEEIDRKLLERAAIEGALKASGDEWANFFPAAAIKQLDQVTANVVTGAGITITKSRSGALRIAAVEAGSPAADSGIRVGDQLLRVNKRNVQGEAATAVAALIRARAGKELNLVVNRGTELLSFSMRVGLIDKRTVTYSQIAPGVGYIAIASFSSGTAIEAGNAVAALNIRDGAIIDLRDNPGGLISEAVEVAEIFINRGVIVSYKVNGQEQIYAASNPNSIAAPVVLLVNRGTTSAAELLAAAFQDRNRGVVIGERTYGKGSVQEFVTLRDGSRLELTVALYLTPSGRTVEGVGVIPDLEVAEADLSLKALQILGGLEQLSNRDKSGAN